MKLVLECFYRGTGLARANIPQFLVKYKMKMNKSFIISLFLIIPILFSACSGTKISTKTSSLKKSKYFRILADADDAPVFVKLQDDLHIDPKLERYTITVDIRSSDPGQQYILFGDDTSPIKYQWTQLSEQVRSGLISWTGSNKENLE